ncbi:MAG: ketopantoate reductase family protein [Agathobacter sp.]|uniref:ketopantoate reductase family protein n=1 Tax=Agathobacter sp. TaxID=2021311 RepID=UPI002588474D|nr:2-dehydropantoate 2-reductase N-terminal domain-containing protein [Agathobacter sp.]MCR5678120.1 ketopantoate reductase family protein [Agathobacter sp.]
MKILFFGRGVIGSQYGWALEKAGHTVDYYVRKGRKDLYAQGINATIYDSRIKDYRKFHWNIHCIDEIPTEHEYDLIFLSINPEQIPVAIEELTPKIGNATLLFFCNYGRDVYSAIGSIPVDQVVFGFPGAGGGYERNDLYGILMKSVEIGYTDSAPTAREKEVIDLFASAGFKISLQKDISKWLFLHYIANAAMEGAAVEAGGFKEAVSSGKALANMARNIRKMSPYLKAKGVRKDALLTVMSILPPKFMGFVMKNLVYKPGSPMYMAQTHNHFKPGYAVEEIKADAKALGITLDIND